MNKEGDTLHLSSAFERLAQITHAASNFVKNAFKRSENLQQALAEEGASVAIDPFGGVDLNSMSREEIGKFAKAYIRAGAKARGEDPDETEAYGIGYLLANHFGISNSLAHKLAIAHIRGEITGEEETRKFIANHPEQQT